VNLTDANTLLYLRARYYNPALGVFTALDPVGNGNRYQYVSANPANRSDPAGLQDDGEVVDEIIGDPEIAEFEYETLSGTSNIQWSGISITIRAEYGCSLEFPGYPNFSNWKW